MFQRKMVTGGASAALLLAMATIAYGSSHREAPAITERPKVDGTDFYMFRSYEPGRQDYVTFIANYQPIQAPYGGPNYFTMDPDAVYEIHVDNNGDAVEDMTFQFKFDNNLVDNGNGVSLTVGGKKVSIPLRQGGMVTAQNPTGFLGETESYTVTKITGDRRSGTRASLKTATGAVTFTKPLDNIGTKTLPNYNAYAANYMYKNVTIPGCAAKGRVFAGQRTEAFAVNLGKIFDLVNLVPIQGAPNPAWPQYNVASPFPGGIVQSRGNDQLIGKANVTSLALEVPIACLTDGTDPVIGAWTTASLPQAELHDPSPTYEQPTKHGGAYVQVSRLSAPLVNELVIGLKDKDLFNAAEPRQDSALAVYVQYPTLPALLDKLFRGAVGSPTDIAPSNFPRNDLVAAFLTGFPGFNASNHPNAKAAEMMRLNTAVPPTPVAQQNTFGVVAEDLAGFPNGRRPGDDVVDIELRVAMGALCYKVPLGAELKVPGAVENQPSDLVYITDCRPADAPVGNQPFTDGAPEKATEFMNAFPYLNSPLPGSGS